MDCMVIKARGQINQWSKIPNSHSPHILKNIFLDIIIIKLKVAVAITKLSRFNVFLLILVSKKKFERLKFFASERREKNKGKQKKNWQNCKKIWIIRLQSALVTGWMSILNKLYLNVNNVNKKFVKIYLQKWHNFNTWNMFSKTFMKLLFSSRVATWQIYRLLIQSRSELWL